jgi:hypothetical protein
VYQGQDRLLAHYLRLLTNLNERLNEASLTQVELMERRLQEMAQIQDGGVVSGQQ